MTKPRSVETFSQQQAVEDKIYFDYANFSAILKPVFRFSVKIELTDLLMKSQGMHSCASRFYLTGASQGSVRDAPTNSCVSRQSLPQMIFSKFFSKTSNAVPHSTTGKLNNSDKCSCFFLYAYTTHQWVYSPSGGRSNND